MSEGSRVFISHAGADTALAREVAGRLGEHGIEPVLDKDRNRPGDSFVAFMHEALSMSDYCLLLWSVAAAASKWVTLEWQGALYRTIAESRAFLVVGRLEPNPPPTLLAPRLFTDLFPSLGPGLAPLIESWRADRQAEAASGRPVGSVAGMVRPIDAGDTVYITSDLFRLTCPLKANLEAPAGLLLDEFRRRSRAPDSIEHEGIAGLRFEYHLAHEDERLERARSLTEQGVRGNDVLFFETDMKPFATTSPSSGQLAGATFRGPGSGFGELREAGRQHLLAWAKQAGFGSAAMRTGPWPGRHR